MTSTSSLYLANFGQSGKSLEEIAELFGDDLATNRLGELDVDAKNGIGPEAELHEFAERRSQA